MGCRSIGCRSNDVQLTLLLKPCHVMVTGSNPKNGKNHHPKTHPVMKVLQVVSFLEFWPLQYWHDWMKLSKRRPIWAWLLIPTPSTSTNPSTAPTPAPSESIHLTILNCSELLLSFNWSDFSVSTELRQLYERPVTISKSRSRCQTPVRNLQPHQSPKSGL